MTIIALKWIVKPKAPEEIDFFAQFYPMMLVRLVLSIFKSIHITHEFILDLLKFLASLIKFVITNEIFM